MQRHLIIPDTQVRPGVPLDHIRAAGKAILEYRPTNIIVMGDWWDMSALSAHEKPGSKHLEGLRYEDDIDAGNEAFEMLIAPMRRVKWKPKRMDFLFGNHENRVDRAVSAEPKYEGALSRKHMLTPGFQRHEFLEPLWLDGCVYSHYFQGSHSSRPLGGSIDAMLNRIGDTFIQGHVQGLKMGNRMYPTGKIRHGIVAGSFYQHDEHYRGPQGRTAGHWNGIIVLNDVRDGDFEIMPLSLKYLQRRFGGKK